MGKRKNNSNSKERKIMAERITGHTELIGLMAYPIRHSSSPAMQNEAFAKLGYDYAYLAFEVDNIRRCDQRTSCIKNERF